MPIKPKPSEATVFEPVEAGTYPARLYSVIHIGTIPFEWQGETKNIDKVRLTFELPTETKVFKEENGEQPYVLSCEFTLSTHEKSNLRKFLEGWQGKRMTDMEAINTDLEEWVGKEGMANVVHSEAKNGNVYANITAMGQLPKGMKCPPAVNEPFILNYNDKWDPEKFATLPEFLKEKMRTSAEYDMITRERPDDQKKEAEDDKINLDDIPF